MIKGAKADRKMQGGDPPESDAILNAGPGSGKLFTHARHPGFPVPPAGPIFAPPQPGMLQRKQTLFLLLAAVCGLLTFAFPVDTFTRGDQTFIFRTYGILTADGVPLTDATMKFPLAILFGLFTALTVAAVFLYKNRPRQLRIVRMTAVFLVAMQALVIITDNSIRAYLQQSGLVGRSHGASFFLPVAMIVLLMLAAHRIKKDEELVRSMDRLR